MANIGNDLSSDYESDNSSISNNAYTSSSDGYGCLVSDTDGSDSEVERPRKQGRMARHEEYPEIITYAKEFLELCSTGAHTRRADSNEYYVGSTCKDMTAYINRKLNFLYGCTDTAHPVQYVSRHTVRRLGFPAHERFKAARHYKRVINAKRGHRQNDHIVNAHKDFHYTASLVKYVMELGAMFQNEVLILSADNKNKINVSVPAVSQYIRPQGMHDKEANPNLPDHTFPERRSKLVPSGYMELAVLKERSHSAGCNPTNIHKSLLPRRVGRARSLSPERKYKFPTIKDERGRDRLRVIRHGTLHLYVFAEYFHKSTSTRHVNHLLDFLPEQLHQSGQSVVFIISDGGPDWNGSSLINVYNYGKLWWQLRLDSLVIVRYAPRHSKYNMIERRWAPLSKRLATVMFDATLPGETTPPWKQNLPPDEADRKCKQVFDKAVKDCCAYLRPDTFKGYGTIARPIFANSDDNDVLTDGDHETNLRLFNRASAAWRRRHPETAQDLKFYLNHCRRSLYKVEFSRCMNQQCECNEKPIRATGYMKLLRSIGSCIPTPVQDIAHKGHYKTLLRILQDPNVGQLDAAIDDPAIRRCHICGFICLSRADAIRHRGIVHGR